jgi:hypothetical protein
MYAIDCSAMQAHFHLPLDDYRMPQPIYLDPTRFAINLDLEVFKEFDGTPFVALNASAVSAHIVLDFEIVTTLHKRVRQLQQKV